MHALRARRGAIAILTVMVFLALMAVGAVVLDFARVELMRNQLQTAADAAALAGAVQLTRSPRTDYLTQAKLIGEANPLLDASIAVPDAAVEVGKWNPDLRVFEDNGNNPTTADAVRVTLRHQSSYLIGNVLGWATKPVAAQSVAWAGPSVANATCMKPWALWLGQLMTRINQYRGLPDDPTRPMTPDDLQALREMPDAQRRFTVFLGHSGQDSTFNGNYYAVTLPPFYHADGTTSDPGSGANEYEKNISGEVCNTVNTGDSLLTEPGIMTGKTCAGVMGTNNCNSNPTPDGICATLANNDCKGPSGEDVVVKTAFWSAPPGSGGRFAVRVELVGSFRLEKFYPTDDKKTNDVDEAASLTGVFEPLADPGAIGSATTTLVRIVLVK